MFDDDSKKPKSEKPFPRNLLNMSVAELDEYVIELKSEIERVGEDRRRKDASRVAAAAVFKS